MTFHLRYLPTDPYGRAGHTVSVAFGGVRGPLDRQATALLERLTRVGGA